MYFVVHGLLQGAALDKARMLLSQARFGDGAMTARLGKTIKNNLEMQVGEPYLQLTDLLTQAIDQCEEISERVLPRFRVAPIINRFDSGMYYAEHIDIPVQGMHTQFGRTPGRFGQSFVRSDLSMTLFLSSREEYDGGELELRMGPHRELVKLQAGSAVLYSTGIPHSVRQVTRGSRVCAIYWFQSMIRDASLRETIWDLHCLERKLQQSSHELAAEARSVRANLIRCFAEV